MAHLLHKPHSPRYGDAVSITAKGSCYLGLCNQMLKPYFKAYTITMRINLPLKNILQGLEHLGRLAKWCMELSGYIITYEPRMVIR